MNPEDDLAMTGESSTGNSSRDEIRRVLELLASPSLAPDSAGRSWQAPVRPARPIRPIKQWAMIAGLAVVVALVAAAGSAMVGPLALQTKAATAQLSATAAPAVPVTSHAIQAQGYVMARRQATVSAETTGRIVEILVTEGSFVRRGEPIAHLNTRIAAAQVEFSTAQLGVARQNIEVSRARLDAAKTVLGRRAVLAAEGWNSKEVLDGAKDQVRQLTAQLQADTASLVVSERQLDIERQSLSNADILAPFDGHVTAVSANVGEIVSPISAGGGFTRTGICTVTDFTSLEGEVDLSEHLLDKVRVGTPVQTHLKAYPGLVVPGHVAVIVPSVDRASSAVQVRIRFDSIPEQVFPGMRIDVEFAAAPPAKAP